MSLKFMIYDSFFSDKKFYDLDNFPDGFEKVSDFTQMEAGVMSRCGHIMSKLYEGSLEPVNEDQQRFIDVIKGRKKPLYHIEYVFLKYLALVQQKEKIVV